jgi:hypothetical protein
LLFTRMAFASELRSVSALKSQVFLDKEVRPTMRTPGE